MLIWEEFFTYVSNQNSLFAQNFKAITNYFINNGVKSIINLDKTEIDYSFFEIEINQSEIYIKKTPYYTKQKHNKMIKWKTI